MNGLPRLNLPLAGGLRFARDAEGRVRVFDPLRRQYVALTPEEYVRQTFVAWMTGELHYPASIMANEVSLKLNGMSRRCDTVVFHPDGRPLMIVEYKAPEVTVTQTTFDQIARYNMVLRAEYLVVSNGLGTYCCHIDYRTGTYQFIPTVPDYAQLRNYFGNN